MVPSPHSLLQSSKKETISISVDRGMDEVRESTNIMSRPFSLFTAAIKVGGASLPRREVSIGNIRIAPRSNWSMMSRFRLRICLIRLFTEFSLVKRDSLYPSARHPCINCWESTDLPAPESPSISVKDFKGIPPPIFPSSSLFPVEIIACSSF